MGDTKGYEGKAAASSDGVTYYEIGGLTDASLPMSRNTIDTTDFDSGGDEEHLAARRSGSFSATAHWDEDDQGLMVVHDAFHAGTTCYIRWRPRGNTAGYQEYLLSGTVTSFEESSSQDAAAEVSFEVAKSGALTEQAQS